MAGLGLGRQSASKSDASSQDSGTNKESRKPGSKFTRLATFSATFLAMIFAQIAFFNVRYVFTNNNIVFFYLPPQIPISNNRG